MGFFDFFSNKKKEEVEDTDRLTIDDRLEDEEQEEVDMDDGGYEDE